ncbi:MAG: hypothetical protein SGI94_04370 [Saprospiraceae bacterium]|nr:hypothetical protein [Saprospiraceae bacterium]
MTNNRYFCTIMSYSQHTTYYSIVYRDFKGIEPGAYRDVLHFYELHEAAIRRAEFEEYFEMLVAYTEALFETGAYRKHLLMADVAIGESMSQELELDYGKQIFGRMLFRKAASHFNLGEYQQAEYITGQLIRIEPGHEQALRFFRKCRYRQRPRWLHNARATVIFLFLLAALVICIEVLLVRPFYGTYVHLVEISRNTIFGMGLLLLIGGEGLHLGLVRSSAP